MIIEQDGENCFIEIEGDVRTIKDCSALKLARTFWEKDGDKYAVDEMEKFGFELKKEFAK